MCNCNNKRSQFRQAQRASKRRAFQNKSESKEQTEKNKVFEYLGTGQLLVQGTNSGTIYRFSRTGARIEVTYEDSFALMAESELTLINE